MKPCTLGKRHRWTFAHNITITRLNGNFASISTRGLYRCTCGVKKHGNADVQIEAEAEITSIPPTPCTLSEGKKS